MAWSSVTVFGAYAVVHGVHDQVVQVCCAVGLHLVLCACVPPNQPCFFVVYTSWLCQALKSGDDYAVSAFPRHAWQHTCTVR